MAIKWAWPPVVGGWVSYESDELIVASRQSSGSTFARWACRGLPWRVRSRLERA